MAVFMLILLSFAGSVFTPASARARETSDTGGQAEENIRLDLFVFAPCESCREDEKFGKEVLGKLTEAGVTDTECRVYNAYKESGASYLEKIVAEYGLGITVSDLPAAIVQGAVYRGTYEEIGKALAADLCDRAMKTEKKDDRDPETVKITGSENTKGSEEAIIGEIRNVEKDTTLLVLFVTGSCVSCEQAEGYLQGIVRDRQCKLLIHNIMEDENAAVIRKLMKIYEVPDSLQQVPLLFLRNGYLSGAEAIRKNAIESLEESGAKGPWEEAASGLLKDNGDISISKIKLLVTGFVNGLNPCGISMLLMVLSVLLMSGKNFFRGSFAFLAGKFMTYLILGFTIGTFFGVLKSRAFSAVHGTINIVFATLSFVFALFYLLDFIHVLRKDYGKEKLRLPERLRKWNHTMIRKLTGVQGWLLYPMLFLLGIVISAGEFLCTGQVYLATLLYMAEQNGGFGGKIIGDLLLYLIAMCVPMVIMAVLAAKGKSIMSASRLSLKLLPVIKLSYSIFFLALCISFIF